MTPPIVQSAADLTKREIKCLRRVATRKSIPDFAALSSLIDKGVCTMSGPSDDLLIALTDLGRALCIRHGIEDLRTPKLKELGLV